MIQLTKLLRAPRPQLALKATPIRHAYHTQTSTMSFETTATIASFGGKLLKLKHKSTSTNTDMELNVFMPPQAAKFSSTCRASHVPETTAQKRASSRMAQLSMALLLSTRIPRQVCGRVALTST
jgi:hypothetical protein